MKGEKDVLYGLRAISDFTGLTYRQAKHRAALGEIPTFNMGRTVCATKSGLTASISAMEARSIQKGRDALPDEINKPPVSVSHPTPRGSGGRLGSRKFRMQQANRKENV